MLQRLVNVTRRTSFIYKNMKNINIQISIKHVTNRGVMTSNCNMNGLHRWYSQAADTTVDYEYVKKATCEPNILIIDVREPEELKEGQIPNSINIPLGLVPTTLGSMPEKEFEKVFQRPKPNANTEIIFYCMRGIRSNNALQDALKLGFKGGKNYFGSWLDWAARTKHKNDTKQLEK